MPLHTTDTSERKSKRAWTKPLLAESVDQATPQQIQLANDMSYEFVGPMPVGLFLKSFLDRASQPIPRNFKRKLQENLCKMSGTDFVTNFIKAIGEASLCSNFSLHDTRSRRYYTRNPEITLYKLNDAVTGRIDLTRMEMPIACLSLDDDPFIDMVTQPESHRNKMSFERYPKRSIRGQIISRTTWQFANQHRCFAFSVIFLDDCARFVRWDRSGAVVTELFKWKEDLAHLALFFWRFNCTSDAGRGYDLTVTKPTTEEIELAKAKLDEWAARSAKAWERSNGKEQEQACAPDSSYKADETFRKFCMIDDISGDVRCLITSHPQWPAHTLTGRSTRGYMAFDAQTQQVVYFKDTWRQHRMNPEGETHRYLEERGIQGIAPLVCTGDIADHTTQTDRFMHRQWCCAVPDMVGHQHYRLVWGEILRPIDQCRSTKEMCMAIFNAVKTHGEAYSVGILHSDISDTNIMITDEGRGVLIDWDLSKRLFDEENNKHRSMVGTWQYMSIAGMQEQGKQQVLSDDLESFLHVLLYCSLERLIDEHPFLANFMNGYFRKPFRLADGSICGLDGKQDFLSATRTLFPQLDKIFCAPLADLIEDLRMLFVPLYACRDKRDVEGIESALDNLKSEKFVDIFERHLARSDEEWKCEPLERAKEERRKRSVDKADLDHEGPFSKRRKSSR